MSCNLANFEWGGWVILVMVVQDLGSHFASLDFALDDGGDAQGSQTCVQFWKLPSPPKKGLKKKEEEEEQQEEGEEVG